MVGQEELLNKINNLQLDTLPHTILIEGKKGSGKHTIANILCEKFNTELIDLKEFGINETTINDLLLSPNIHFCVLDLKGISIREQNVMLKFLEEPLNHCYIILFCEHSSQVLPTVFNRCQHWKMSFYTKEQLKSFYDEYTMFNEFQYANDKIFEIAETPGDIKELLETNIDDVINLINNIIQNIGKANFSNALVLVDKIKEFNPDKGFVNFDIFLKVFFYVLKEQIKHDSNIRLLDMYYKLQDIYKLHEKPYLHLNEKQLYEKFLLDLKTVAK